MELVMSDKEAKRLIGRNLNQRGAVAIGKFTTGWYVSVSNPTTTIGQYVSEAIAKWMVKLTQEMAVKGTGKVSVLATDIVQFMIVADQTERYNRTGKASW